MATTITRYSDFDMNMIEHPGLKNILPKTDAEAVKRSVRNLFNLMFGEKPFHPERAIGLRQYLFEQMTPITFAKMRRDITQVLNTFEPRVSINDIQFGLINDEGTLMVTLVVTIVNIPETETITIYLDRIR